MYGSTEELWFAEWEFGGSYWSHPEGYTRQNPRDFVKSFKTPTLVVHGDADILVPTENGKLIAARIPGAELVLIPGAGHMLQADGGDAVRAALLGFLARAAR